MVKQYSKKGKALYRCEDCGLGYVDMKTAKECEDFCRKHHSCSMEITKKAVDFG
jgi:hypothetical protein